MDPAELFATPREVKDLEDCYFYHSVDLPEFGEIPGEWDLRPGARDYTGGIELKGKRVLEVGTATGFLCFYMESRGAEVIAYDLSDRHLPDVVPYAQYDFTDFQRRYQSHIRRINNSFWLCHRALRSRAQVVYGTVYDIPPGIGPVDVSTFGSVLLHVRDPFLALANAARLTRETIVVTEIVLTSPSWLERLSLKHSGPWLRFYPDASRCHPKDTWWLLSPAVVRRFLEVLGFETTRVTYHVQKHRDRDAQLFTVVGMRRDPSEPVRIS